MKKTHRLFSLLLLLLAQLSLFAQEKNKQYAFVKNKAINKSYNVSASEKLSIHNSFGSVEVHTWNKNEIKVDVAVEASADKEATVQKLIDAIEVKDQQNGNNISFKTSINGSKNSKNGKSSMSINYSIYMPASNPLSISNEFGATIVPDFSGEVDLTSKFGSLNTGALKNIKQVTVEFGKANFESLSNCTVAIKYSTATFSKLLGKMKLNFEFCSASRVNIDDNLTSLELGAAYSTVNLRPVGNISASYNIFTSFGTFKNNTGIKFESDENEEEKGPKFDHTYQGKTGSGSIPVKANTSFGKIILGEASAEDLKGKGKSKTKTV